jgi:O-antigen ligase
MSARERNYWAAALSFFGLFSLTSMAGMGIGGAVFFITTLVILFRSWNRGGAEILGRFRSQAWTYLTVAYFAVCLLSLVIAYFYPVEEGMPNGFADLKKFHYFLLPPLVALAFLYSSDELEEHPFWTVWASMGAFLALIAFLQFWGSELFPDAWLENRFFRRIGTTNRFHAQGLMFFHLSFASCMCFMVSTAFARVLWPRLRDSLLQRGLWLALGVASFLAVFFSFSRISFAALAAILAFLGFLKRPAWGVIALVLVAVSGFVVWQKSESLQARWRDTQVGNLERVLMWESAWAMFEDRPITGVGFNRTGEYSPVYATRILGYRPQFTSHAHNNFLDSLASTGLLGFSLFLAWWIALFVMAARCFREAPGEERWLPAACLAGLLAFQINGLTQINFWDGKSEPTLMIWIGITLALWLRHQGESGEFLVEGRR